MTFRVGTFLIALALALTSLAAADDPKPDEPEPPVRLKKKDRPKTEPPPEKKTEPPREGAKKKDKEAEPEGAPAEDPKQVLARLSKNMKESADRLARSDSGDATRQTLRDIIKDLDTLLRQQQQQGSQSASTSSSPQNSNDKQQQARSGSRRMQQRMARGQRRRSQNRMARGQQQNQPQDRQTNNGGMNPGGGGAGKNLANKRPDPYKDIWGHLPEALRMQMDAYSRQKFMAKYDDLLKQYYATIAEKDRR